MTASSMTTPPTLRGDLCPPWCIGPDYQHQGDREDKTHPIDRGVSHLSTPIAAWTRDSEGCERLALQPVAVYVEGFRHDAGQDWPDTVIVYGADESAERFQVSARDARLVAMALLVGADMIEGKP